MPILGCTEPLCEGLREKEAITPMMTMTMTMASLVVDAEEDGDEYRNDL